MKEILARVRISNTLRTLGWESKKRSKRSTSVSLNGGTFFAQEYKKQQRGPDYILYRNGSKIPIGLIEVKKEKSLLSDSLSQAEKYARRLRLKDVLVFSSDGNITQARHVGSGKSPTINGEVVEELLPMKQVVSLLACPNLYEERAIQTAKDIIAVFNSACVSFRKDGIEAGMDSLREFCLILFVKIMSEKNLETGKITWYDIICAKGDRQLETFKQVIRQYKEKYDDVIEETKITKPHTLKDIVSKINQFNFSQTASNIKGDAYEYFLSKYSTANKSTLGQYFTPRHITQMIGKILNPYFHMNQKVVKIYDPFCGTGGMLVGCYNLLKNQMVEQPEQLNKNVLYGNDVSKQASQIAKINMILLGCGHSNILKTDSFVQKVDKKYDCVVTNIPFNMGSSSTDIAEQYGTKELDSNVLAIRHCLCAVKNGGSAGIIVPESIAYLEKYQKLRDFLKNNAIIRAVIRLPKKLFVQYASARTCLLVLSDIWERTTQVFPVMDLKYDGFSESKKREPTIKNDIPALLNFTENFFKYPGCEKRKTNQGYTFFDVASIKNKTAKKGWILRSLLDVKKIKTPLDPQKFYAFPSLNSSNNTVSVREERLGSNVSNYKKGRIIAKKGDLIIGTLHTQSGKGLFAIADRNYITSSQIVARIKEDKIDEEYLVFQLRQILPKLKKDDLVGRETYSEKELLGLYIPQPDAKWPGIKRKIKNLEIKKEKIQCKINQLIHSLEIQ